MFVYVISSFFIVSLVAVCCQTRRTHLHDARVVGEETYDLLSKHKRQVSCADRYAKITTGHSACLPKKNSGVVPGVQQLILDAHNTARRGVTPTASNMQLMTWDVSLANIAQRWADNCSNAHEKPSYKRCDFGRFSVGQNLAYGYSSWTGAIEGWAKEKKDFTYGTDNKNKVVGHYTQMVWAQTSKVGCGYAVCNGRPYYVCNYGPAGNYMGEQPYANGTTCAMCPKSCTNRLCGCGGLVCLNGGVLDLKECKCNCRKSFHMQPNCALKCDGAVDSTHCPGFYSGKCEVWTNVPVECPKMCKWCPYADAKFLK
ncbi:cysteine-rich venom protein latisemin-like [Dreissena polymorpha]|uniref:SCP domain-containing protein n=1 Tax=Dreissena polymorpha TaxID=45954 RepID=A0A9D4D3B7_DREPO|nr:cysteine-rich venom protein latisemin-like [Dreissena polymorpha]KAH3736563.1 hypothetical protein DPMN_043134 [Dreissena polymorpha]